MSNPITKISWAEIEDAAVRLAVRHKNLGHRGVWGIPTGGSVVAPFVGKALGIPVLPSPEGATLIVDDMVDSGRTMKETYDRNADVIEGFGPPMVDALFRKPNSPKHLASRAVIVAGWLHFPWEKEARPEDAVVRLLQFIGEDVGRDGLKETPARVCKALNEMTQGYFQDPGEILSKTFDESYDEVVVLKGIPFTSLCEHHLLPFIGTADVGYIPGKVVGLSKLARLVDCFAMRLQLQERMTRQIADSLMTHLNAKGAAVIVRAVHSCMACRGIKKAGAEMVTSAMLGLFRDDPKARGEFLELCR